VVNKILPQQKKKKEKSSVKLHAKLTLLVIWAHLIMEKNALQGWYEKPFLTLKNGVVRWRIIMAMKLKSLAGICTFPCDQ
jgi:hypothetical protein